MKKQSMIDITARYGSRHLSTTTRTLGILSILLLGLLLAGCVGISTEMPAPTVDDVVQPTATPAPEAEADESETVDAEAKPVDSPKIIALDHIHGFGWDPSGTTLSVATHTGLRIFENDHWFNSKGPAHDYIAMAPTADGFYASGSPAPSASEGEPLGLVKSTDLGETLQMLSFEGESAIHFLGAGYETNTVYVVIDEENSIVSPGLHYSYDDGANWQISAAQGVTSVIIQMAAHPTNDAILAFASEGGVLLSTDNGNSFAPVTDQQSYSALTFSPAEEGVLYYGLDTLYRLAPDGSEPEALNMPALRVQDAMMAVAVNPTNPNEIVIATFDSYVWHTTDHGETWVQIADPTATRKFQ